MELEIGNLYMMRASLFALHDRGVQSSACLTRFDVDPNQGLPEARDPVQTLTISLLGRKTTRTDEMLLAPPLA
jgi:hypothetical protein